MDLVSQGSEDAVWELVERYTPQILRAVRRRLPPEIRSKLDSTDILQSTWMLMLRGEPQKTPYKSAEEFISHLATSAKLKVLGARRTYRTMSRNVHREESLDAATLPQEFGEVRQRHPLEDHRHQSASSIAVHREQWDRVVKEHGDRGRRMIELRLRGLGQEEVAAELGVSKSTVRRMLQSMLEALSR